MTCQPISRDFRAHKMKVAHQISARVGEVLDNDQLRTVVPSIFATTAHESRSERFRPIPTVAVLDGLRNEGFQPVYAAQARTRIEGKAEFTKHMVRMRHASRVSDNGTAFEVLLVNGNDGTAAYNLLPGFFRFICANGMITGDRFEPIKVRHTGNVMDNVIEGTFRVLDEAQATMDRIEAQRLVGLSRDESVAFAEAAHVLRFPDAYRDQDDPDRRAAPIDPQALLVARRVEDRAPDLWTTFNRVQENVIKGGQQGRTTRADGQRVRATTRPVTGIDQNVALNRALSTLADRMAQIKAAA